jgi:hypothetical protein
MDPKNPVRFGVHVAARHLVVGPPVLHLGLFLQVRETRFTLSDKIAIVTS